ncbi:MFS transporter [Mycolicibacterium sp. P1-5]|uniref:CynX/NimT family MFS transporter n=1 Tax=Mycolicibacterium sp. P1-5 TaxID=2024617 RepID=UPI0011EBF9F0|nr:MFS transporter [Mycolicibacterium sp. P1-5]KAA0108169.1 MFS transporter [Mycolicibacterium sp. P1-5]
MSRYERDLSLELDGAVEVPSGERVAAGAVLIVAVVLTAVNLRPAVTSVGPVLGDMQRALGASAVWAGVLTTLPGLCFAGAGLASAALSRRLGVGRSISLALATLIVGLLVRVLDGPYVVIGGTLVATAGIAVINVLIPVVIKQSFPARLGLMTGIYTAALQGGGALGSAVTPPLENIYGGWRPALGAWAMLAVVALVIWLIAARRVESPADSAESGARRSLIRNPLAWTVTLFFGTQSLLAYIMMGWLPEVFIDSGVDKTSAGLLVGLLSVIAVPISLVLAPMAARSAHQSGWIAALGVCGFTGVVGLLVAPDFSPLLWSVLVGIGMSVFSLALTVIALRARTPEDTVQLSAMAQGFGYLLAGIGPFLFGTLHDVTGNWTVPWMMVLGVYAVQILLGVLAGRNRYV